MGIFSKRSKKARQEEEEESLVKILQDDAFNELRRRGTLQWAEGACAIEGLREVLRDIASRRTMWSRGKEHDLITFAHYDAAREAVEILTANASDWSFSSQVQDTYGGGGGDPSQRNLTAQGTLERLIRKTQLPWRDVVKGVTAVETAQDVPTSKPHSKRHREKATATAAPSRPDPTAKLNSRPLDFKWIRPVVQNILQTCTCNRCTSLTDFDPTDTILSLAPELQSMRQMTADLAMCPGSFPAVRSHFILAYDRTVAEDCQAREADRGSQQNDIIQEFKDAQKSLDGVSSYTRALSWRNFDGLRRHWRSRGKPGEEAVLTALAKEPSPNDRSMLVRICTNAWGPGPRQTPGKSR